MSTPNISDLVNKHKSADQPLVNFYLDPEIINLDQEKKEELAKEFKSALETVEIKRTVGVPASELYRGLSGFTEDEVAESDGFDYSETINSSLSSGEDSREKFGAFLRDPQNQALLAVPTNEKTSSGKKQTDQEQMYGLFEKYVTARTKENLASLKAEYNRTTGLEYDNLSQDKKAAKEALLRLKTIESEAGPILLGIDVVTDAYRKTGEITYDPKKATQEQIVAIREYAASKSLEDSQDLYDFDLTSLSLLSGPTLRLSNNSTNEEIEQAVQDIEKYGTSALFDSELSRPEQVDQIAQALNILSNKLPEEKYALVESQIDPGYKAGFIPTQTLKELEAISNTSSDSAVVARSILQYKALDKLRKEKELPSGEAVRINTAIKHLVETGPLEEGTAVNKIEGGEPLQANGFNVPGTTQPTYEYAEAFFPDIVSIKSPRTTKAKLSVTDDIFGATEESEAEALLSALQNINRSEYSLLMDASQQALGQEQTNLKVQAAPYDEKVDALEQLKQTLDVAVLVDKEGKQVSYKDLTFKQRLEALATPTKEMSNKEYYNKLAETFPTIDSSLWETAYTKEESAELFNTLLAILPGTSQAADLSSGLNERWDQIRKKC